MAISYKFWIGFVLLSLLTSGIVYIQLQDDVKIRVDDDKTTFYVKNENNRWTVLDRDWETNPIQNL